MCPRHGIHTGEEGPFCFEPHCKAKSEEMTMYQSMYQASKQNSRHTFLRINKPFPEVGDLIRNSGDTSNFINIVLEVSAVQEIKHFLVKGDRDYVAVRSVRYGATNDGDFKLLNGQRSRSFRFYRSPGKWDVVEEYVKCDNSTLRAQIVKSMEGVDTAWKPPVITSDDEICYEALPLTLKE
jgi:hypothetical protein